MTLQVNDNPVNKYHRPNNFTRLGLPFIPRWASKQALTIEPGKLSLIDMLTRAFAKQSGIPTGQEFETPAAAAIAASANSSANVTVPLLAFVGTFPDLQVTNFQQFVEIIGAILHPIALSLQLPLFVFVTVMEKEERLVELQRAMGMRYGPYQAVNYGLNFLLYAAVCGFFWAGGAILRFELFSHTAPGLLALAFIGWGLALCSLATLLSAFLWSRKAATVAGYVVALFSNLFAIIVAAGIYGSQLGLNFGAMPTWLYVVPSFGLVRFLYLATFNCIAKQACYTSVAQAMAPGGEVLPAIVSMYVDAVVFLVMGLYLDQVLPRRYGVAKHPLFCLPARLRRALCCGRGEVELASPASGVGSSVRASVNSVEASHGTVGKPVAAASGPLDNAVSASAAADGSLFAYIQRWARFLPFGPHAQYRRAASTAVPTTLPAPTPAAAAAAALVDYAAGEDADVLAARQLIEREIWPQAQAALRARQDTAGGGSSGGDDTLGRAAPGAAIAGDVRDGVFAEYPVIIRHLRKEFETQASAPMAAASAAAGSAAMEKSDGGAGSPIAELSVPLLASAAAPTVPAAATTTATAAAFAPAPASASLVAGVYEEREQEVLGARGVKVAVSDMSIALRRDRVFGALGENGAGKSTLVSMLIGLYPPTAGDAYVVGHHIAHETDAVRRSIGVCLQQDILWANLTVAEHVRFYARLKGVPQPELDAHVHDAVARVGLAQFADRFAGALSGGMKRRLSLAVALAGDSALIIADECTTGLDPGSKRRIWRIIEQNRAGRVWIIVSHDMAEVETLCQDIGIMTYGRLRSLGTQQRLKARYGGGYVLQCNYRTEDEVREEEDAAGGAGAAATTGVLAGAEAALPSLGGDIAPRTTTNSDAAAARRVIAMVQGLFPGATIDGRFTGYLSFMLPASVPVHTTAATPSPASPLRSAKDGPQSRALPGPTAGPHVRLQLSRVFQGMQECAAAAGVQDWQVGQVSLDTVFSRIVKHYRAGGRSAAEEDDSDEEEPAEAAGPGSGAV
jgi:ABC-type multidrug transport system ATPase subunit